MQSKINMMIFLCFLIGCRKESGDESVKRIFGNKFYNADSTHIPYLYRDALRSAAKNKWNDNNSLNTINRELQVINQHSFEYPSKSSGYNELINLLKKWPVRVSKGYIYRDDWINEIVKERIQAFKWITYEDYLSNSFSEYKLDTIHLSWKKIRNDNIGIEIWLPPIYKIFKKETDTSLTFRLERIDTIAGQYYVPNFKGIIDISILRSNNSFDEVAPRFGFIKEDSLWYNSSLGWSDAIPVDVDSIGKKLFMSRYNRSPDDINDHEDISFSLRSISSTVNIYLFVKQHIIVDYGRDAFNTIYWFENSFTVIKRQKLN